MTFNGAAATPTSWKTGSIAVPVPAAATTGSVVVKVGGVASNGVTFTVTPVVTTLSPTSGAVGTSVTINGSGFGTSQGSNTVSFNSVSTTPTSWNDITIVAPVPTGAGTGPVIVMINRIASNGVTFTVPPVLESIAVTPQSSSVAAGLNEQLTATGTYSDNSTQNLSSSVVWMSSATAVATVNNTGLVTGAGQGSATISANLAGIAGSTGVTVTPPVLTGIAVSPTNLVLPQGATQQLTAMGNYSDGSQQDITATVAWSANNTSIATVNSSGLVTAVTAGGTTIVPSLNGVEVVIGITVSQPGPPTITASASPKPNAAGWNDTNVTVTFTCDPGSYAVSSCPEPQVVSTEGQNQIISGTVTDTQGNNATATVTLNVDKTPPALIVTAPTAQEVFSTASITASGTLSDSLSGLSSLSCNGAADTPAASYSCNISLTPGLNLVVVQATDVAGNIALVKMHVVLNTPLPAPASLQITPANAIVSVGDSQQFTAVDDQGRARSDATWTVSNTSIATITTDTSPWLTGLSVGTVTLTATVQQIQAAEQVTVVSGPLSSGTIPWSAPPDGFQVQQVAPAGSIGIGPDLFSYEYSPGQGGQGSFQTLGLTLDGQQMWSRPFGQQNLSGASAGADASGGLLVSIENGASGPVLMDLDSQTGATVWQQNIEMDGAGITGPLNNGLYSLRADGSVAIFGIAGSGPYSVANYPDEVDNLLEIVNGSTGQIAPVPIQPVSWSFNCGAPQGFDPAEPGDSMIVSMATDSAGNTYVEYNHEDQFTQTLNDCAEGSTETESETVSVRVLTIAPDGSTSDQILATSTMTATCEPVENVPSLSLYLGVSAGTVIPDGQGGFLATWLKTPAFGSTPPCGTNQYPSGSPQTEVTHVAPNGGGTYELPLTEANDQLVLGEDGTAFAVAGQQQLVSFNVNSGAVNWSYQSPTSIYPLVSSNTGGLAAKEFDNGLETVLRFDASGNVTRDTWSAHEIFNYGGSLWFGYSTAGVAAYAATPVELSASPWYAPDGNGGNAAAQNLTITNASQTGDQQPTIIGVVQELFDAINLSGVFPGAQTCHDWLGAGGRSLNTLQGFVPAQWKHADITAGGFIDYNTLAATAPGDPAAPTTWVNNQAGFFSTTYPSHGAIYIYSIGPRGYAGNEILAQSAIAMHELGHQAYVPSDPSGEWQQNDMGNRKHAVDNNNKLIDNVCGQMIRMLPGVNPITDLPPFLSVGLSPTAGAVGSVVTINGTNFGSTQGNNSISFNGVVATTVSKWSNTQLKATVPAGATTGNIIVTVSGVRATGPVFTVQ